MGASNSVDSALALPRCGVSDREWTPVAPIGRLWPSGALTSSCTVHPGPWRRLLRWNSCCWWSSGWGRSRSWPGPPCADAQGLAARVVEVSIPNRLLRGRGLGRDGRWCWKRNLVASCRGGDRGGPAQVGSHRAVRRPARAGLGSGAVKAHRWGVARGTLRTTTDAIRLIQGRASGVEAGQVSVQLPRPASCGGGPRGVSGGEVVVAGDGVQTRPLRGRQRE